MLDLRLDVPELEPDPRLLAELSARSAGSAPSAGGTGRVLLAAASVAVVAGVSWLTGALPGADSPLGPEPVHRPAPAPTGTVEPAAPAPVGAAAAPSAAPPPAVRTLPAAPRAGDRSEHRRHGPRHHGARPGNHHGARPGDRPGDRGQHLGQDHGAGVPDGVPVTPPGKALGHDEGEHPAKPQRPDHPATPAGPPRPHHEPPGQAQGHHR